jgi:hypothetical protein
MRLFNGAGTPPAFRFSVVSPNFFEQQGKHLSKSGWTTQNQNSGKFSSVRAKLVRTTAVRTKSISLEGSARLVALTGPLTSGFLFSTLWCWPKQF